MPRDMAGQARAALENLKRGLEAVGATFADIVTADRFVHRPLRPGCAQPGVGANISATPSPTTTTVQVVRLATDPRCLVRDQRGRGDRLTLGFGDSRPSSRSIRVAIPHGSG